MHLAMISTNNLGNYYNTIYYRLDLGGLRGWIFVLVMLRFLVHPSVCRSLLFLTFCSQHKDVKNATCVAYCCRKVDFGLIITVLLMKPCYKGNLYIILPLYDPIALFWDMIEYRLALTLNCRLNWYLTWQSFSGSSYFRNLLKNLLDI